MGLGLFYWGDGWKASTQLIITGVVPALLLGTVQVLYTSGLIYDSQQLHDKY